MAETVRLIDPQKLHRNPDNPRLIFHEDELADLEKSIKQQGILVPLTIYEKGRAYYLLDGERRWRCARKLGLERVPVIVQPRPDRLQNIMMMFAIHNTRRDWDPLPAALKLEDLEDEFERRNGRAATEQELAQMASVSRGEVRRLRNLLRLPDKYRDELLAELRKPRSEQQISADHLLETTRGAAALAKRRILDHREEDQLRESILAKFRTGVIDNTTAPRKLARVARAVDREEIPTPQARKAAKRLIDDPKYSIDQAFADTVERLDYEHGTEQLAERVIDRLLPHEDDHHGELGDSLRDVLERLAATIERILNK